jgi:hypothetical protein
MCNPFVPPHPGNVPIDGDGNISDFRFKENRSEVVLLDTKDFKRPIAIVQLPFHVKAQIHGNWVENKVLPKWWNRLSGYRLRRRFQASLLWISSIDELEKFAFLFELSVGNGNLIIKT